MPKLNQAADLEVTIDRRRKDRRPDDLHDVDSTDANKPGKSAKKKREPKTTQSSDSTEATFTEEAVVTQFKAPRRRKERRRQIDPTTCERDYNSEEIDFMQALDAYKRSSGRMFPTCSEILEVIRDLGYIKLSAEEKELLSSIEAVEAEMAETISEALPETDDISFESAELNAD